MTIQDIYKYGTDRIYYWGPHQVKFLREEREHTLFSGGPAPIRIRNLDTGNEILLKSAAGLRLNKEE